MCGLYPSMSRMRLCQFSSDLLVVTSNLYGGGDSRVVPFHLMNGIPVCPVM